ncbi:MAG: glycosyltransferase family 4 protein [Deltaproteobacteria bacterium]|nr:glycosyltransferase family 4 protein [Deltaproteobacteria bacterium]
MRIAININELTLNQNTGVKVYTREIVNALGRVDRENKYLLYCRRDTKFCVQKGIKFYAPTNNNFKLKTSKSLLPFWTYFKFPREIKKDKPDVLFMPIQSAPFLKKPKDIKLVITVHDLAFLLFPKHFTFKDRFLLNFHTKRAIRMADRIIVPSKATKNDIIKFYGVDGNKIKVIYHGVETRQCLVSTTQQLYILFVGSIQPRKNIVRLIEAFEILKNPPNPLLQRGNWAEENPPNPLFQRGDLAPPFKKGAGGIKLIIAGGRGWMADEIYKKAKGSKFSDDIIFMGSVSDNKLADLYKNAAIFVLPSLYEGFGLPVLEAMSYGIPCVISDNSSLSEIAGDSALLVDAYNPNDIAEKINVLLNDEKLRKELSEKGIENAGKFSWIKAAEKTLAVLSSE